MINVFIFLAALLMFLRGQENDLLLVVVFIVSIGIINIKSTANTSIKKKSRKLSPLAFINGILIFVIYGLIVAVLSNNNWIQKDVLYPESINSIQIVLDLLALSIIVICVIFKYSNTRAGP